MTALASFSLVGFAAVVSATAVAVSASTEIDMRPEGRIKMIEAEYQLATTLRR